MSKKKGNDQRSNTLPRFLPEDNNNNEGTRLLSQSLKLNSLDKNEIKRLLKSEDDSINRNQAMHRMEVMKAEELERRKNHEKQIYNLDYGTLDQTFALPGKPDAKTSLPPDTNIKTKSKKSKVQENQFVDKPAVNQNFLPNALGQEGEVTTFGTDPTAGNTSNKKTLSDLDEINSIMANIKTSDAAINFFARYGGDTPVSTPW
jgi:hypothetical protein